MQSISKVSGGEQFALHEVNKHCIEKRNENQEDFRKFQLQRTRFNKNLSCCDFPQAM
jgi:hypothetical protein